MSSGEMSSPVLCWVCGEEFEPLAEIRNKLAHPDCALSVAMNDVIIVQDMENAALVLAEAKQIVDGSSAARFSRLLEQRRERSRDSEAE